MSCPCKAPKGPRKSTQLIDVFRSPILPVNYPLLHTPVSESPVLYNHSGRPPPPPGLNHLKHLLIPSTLLPHLYTFYILYHPALFILPHHIVLLSTYTYCTTITTPTTTYPQCTVPLVTVTAARSVLTQTLTRIGPRSPILQSAGAFKTALRSGTTVSFLFFAQTCTIFYLLTTPTGKKLKRRLEDLERRAASSASPEATHAEPVAPAKEMPSKPRSKQSRTNKVTDHKAHGAHGSESERPGSYNYYTTTQDERGMFGQQCTRQLSASPPPVFSYPPMPNYDNFRPGYGQLPGYHTVPSSYSDLSFAEYGEPVPSILPIVTAPAIGRKTYDEDMMSPFSMSYASMAGIDIMPQPHTETSLPVQIGRAHV